MEHPKSWKILTKLFADLLKVNRREERARRFYGNDYGVSLQRAVLKLKIHEINSEIEFRHIGSLFKSSLCTIAWIKELWE